MIHLEHFRDATEHEDTSPPWHPAAFSPLRRAGEMAKHVLGKALKYAVLAGIAGAALFALIPGAFLGPVASVASMFSHRASETIMLKVAAAAIAGAKSFALGGALLGAAVGLTGASEAADYQEEERIASYERRDARQKKQAALAQRDIGQFPTLGRQPHGLSRKPNAELPFVAR